MSSDVLNLPISLDKVREELAELDDLKAVRIAFAEAARDYRCHHCSVTIGIGCEVTWIRTKGDNKFVPDSMVVGSSWKSRPWHRLCWDQWEFAVDQDRIRLEGILGEDNHEFRPF